MVSFHWGMGAPWVMTTTPMDAFSAASALPIKAHEQMVNIVQRKSLTAAPVFRFMDASL
jgi:hypothetical protein